MSADIVTMLVALTTITGVFAVYQIVSDLYLSDRSRVSDRVDEEFLKKKVNRARKSSLFKNLENLTEGPVPELRTTFRQRFEAMIEQSGMDTTPARILAISAGAAVGGAVLGFLARGNPIDAAIATTVAAAAPTWVVKRRRDRRIEKLRSQLAEAFDLMARVVRAGQTLSQAMLAVAEEFPQPISSEFAFCCEQQNLGLPPEVTFRDLNRRTGIVELKIFVLAVLVQQQTGGNLADLLLKLAAVVRERYQLRGMIKTMTAEGRIQGWVLAGLPPLMLVLMVVLNRSYVSVLFERPKILLGTFGIELVGALWIRKIVNFDF